MHRCEDVMTLRATITIATLSLLFTTRAIAQVETGQIFGRVSDASGAVLPGVTVTVAGPGLLQPLVAVASESGSYQFPRLAVGIYNVKFELPGFRTVIRQDVRVSLGFNARVDAQLEVATVEETVTVSGVAPVVDTRSTGTGGTFSQEMLQNLPTARDPWVVIKQTPGIVMARENVGGTESGQQVGYSARGSSSNTSWNMDGVVMQSAVTNASPIYYDFDSFEEMQVTTGGADASQQGAGVSINIVTKSGTDRFKGSSRLYVVSERFQSDNVDEGLRAQGAASGNPVQFIRDFGFEVGGPLVKGRAWYWGGYAKQDIKVGILGYFVPGTDRLGTNHIVLDNYNVKLQGQVSRANKVSWFSNFSDKIQDARDASELRPLETTFNQTSPVWTHKISDQHVFSDRLMLDVALSQVGGVLYTDFHSPDVADVQRSLELVSPAGLYGRSFTSTMSDRPQTNIDASVNYFLPSVLGGDHALRSGFRYRYAPTDSISRVGGNTTARFRNGVAVEAELHRNSITDFVLEVASGYVQDTYSRGRVTASAGLRFDRQWDYARATSVPAHPFLPEFLPAVSFAGANSGVPWTDLSPRLGLNFDLTGDSTTVAKVSFGRYYGQMTPTTTAGILNPVNAAAVRFPWNDLNNDRFVQPNELTTSTILAFSGNYDPANPSFIGTANTVDPNLRSDRTTEAMVSVDHQLAQDFAVGASYIWRRYDRLAWEDREGLSSADYVPVTFTATGCPGGCPQVTYYQPVIPVPAVQRLTNRPDHYRSFNGLELTARKRYTQRWMLNGSLAFSDARDHYTSPASYEDPTTIPFSDNAQISSNSSRWVVNLSGLYKLPWEVNVGLNYFARQGFPFVRTILSPSRANRAGTIQIPLEPIGESRLAALQLLDLKVEKFIALPRGVRVSASVDVFNLANANTALVLRSQQNATNANQVSMILAPRIARFGLRLLW
jgi:hypothetical protein